MAYRLAKDVFSQGIQELVHHLAKFLEKQRVCMKK
jgi:hypothetical protein